MEHILLCSDDVAYPPLEVAYLCDDSYSYDDLGLFTYPDRVKVDAWRLSENRSPTLALTDAVPFLQAWLWFGLLGDALNVRSRRRKALKLLSSDAFIRETGSGKYLCTDVLSDIISEARGDPESLFSCEASRSRLFSLTRVAEEFIHRAMVTPVVQAMVARNSYGQPLHHLAQTLLAIQVLCETLKDSALLGLPEGGQEEADLSLWPETSLEVVNYLLRRSGWCAVDIRRLPRKAAFRYHLSFYHRTSRSRDPCHSRLAGCECDLRAEEAIISAHTHESCNCRLVGPPLPLLEEMVQQGEVSLFRFRHDCQPYGVLESKKFKILSDIEPPYVAISHVRMEGLGNDNDNMLPSCQLSIIQAFVNQVNLGDPDGTFFWIDTLSVPVKNPLGKIALGVVADIFARARSVLVWDPPLYRHTFTNAEEALLRIRYSNWKSRVWTLQEAFVARHVVFRFANGLVSLQMAVHDFENESKRKGPGTSLLHSHNTWPSGLYHSLCVGEWLPTSMKCFEEDIKTWSQEAQHANLDPGGNAKTILYKYLRLGFLSAQRFRYFLEDDEIQQLPLIWDFLRRTYGLYTSERVNDTHATNFYDSSKRLETFLNLVPELKSTNRK